MSNTKYEDGLQSAFSFDRKLLLFAGFYPRRSSKNNGLYLLGAFVNLFFSFGQILTIMIWMIMNRNDLSKIAESLHYLTTLITYVLKLLNFMIYRENLLDIEDNLSKPALHFSHEQLKLLKNKINSSKNVGNIFRFLCVVAVTSSFITPILDNSESRKLPYPGWFPYNATKYYYTTFVFQVFGVANTAYTNSSFDILTCILISIASGQFEILKYNLKNINWKDDSNKIEKQFVRYVKHHEEIVRLVHKIEKTFSKGIFVQFLASVLVICVTVFSLMIVPVFSMQFGYLIFYFICMMWQCGMYCWFGHDVMTTSITINDSFYTSNWYESNLKIRRSFFIFMEKTKKPVMVRAGGFFTLSLATLTGILKSSYSYYAVLRRVYDKE